MKRNVFIEEKKNKIFNNTKMFGTNRAAGKSRRKFKNLRHVCCITNMNSVGCSAR